VIVLLSEQVLNPVVELASNRQEPQSVGQRHNRRCTDRAQAQDGYLVPAAFAMRCEPAAVGLLPIVETIAIERSCATRGNSDMS
jgi:hypothetical protein